MEHVSGRVEEHTGFWWGGGGEMEGKRLLGRRRCKWKFSIKMDIQEIGWRGAWTWLIWHRIGTSLNNLRVL
jgi:hypothetical protein